MSPFEHLRHKPPTPLNQAREIIVAVPEMQSNVNLSRIVRAAGCCGIPHVIAAGRGKIDPKIARNATEVVTVGVHRSLLPQLHKYRAEGYRIVGLEQTTYSKRIYEYSFQRRTLLVVGHERIGIPPDLLAVLDDAVEIPMFGQPYSHNAATAAAIAMYEYCRQFPDG
jgi:tRNA G18 (ribose-2'-O)-methylase SpoU